LKRKRDKEIIFRERKMDFDDGDGPMSVQDVQEPELIFESVIKEADQLYTDYKYEESCKLLLPHRECDYDEVLWRLVRAMHEKAKHVQGISEEDKKYMSFEAFVISKKALEKGEDNFACHKWYGIMLNQTAEYNGKKESLKASPEVKQHWERAIELNPHDSACHHLVGMWNFKLADMGTITNLLAKVPSATYEEALQSFTKAAETSSSGGSHANLYMTGKVLLKLGRKKEAKERFTELVARDCHDDEERGEVEKAKKKLKSL